MAANHERETGNIIAHVGSGKLASAMAGAGDRTHGTGNIAEPKAGKRPSGASSGKIRARVKRATSKDTGKTSVRRKPARRGAEGTSAGSHAHAHPIADGARNAKAHITGGFEAVGSGIKHGAETAAKGVAHAGGAVANAANVGITGTKETFRKLFGNKDGEIGYFAPKTWDFWRALIVCFCGMCLLGHLLEIPYCLAMDSMFGIVDDTYPVWTDPWYHPYWVYGVGAVLMTLFIEPFKERLVIRRKTIWGAMLQCFVIMVALCAAMECIIGWLVNQPDPVTGLYPYWDNSQLPGNIFGQAWIVNDIAIAIAAMIYVWLVYPLVCRALAWLRPAAANASFAFVVIGFAGCCIASYGQLISWGVLG